jgi:hypothetical protein
VGFAAGEHDICEIRFCELFGRYWAICLLEGSGHREEVPDVGELEELEDAWAHSCRNQPNPLALTPNIVANHHAEAGRIHVWDLSEIEDMNRSLHGVRR